jgi:hypothetical protein
MGTTRCDQAGLEPRSRRSQAGIGLRAALVALLAAACLGVFGVGTASAGSVCIALHPICLTIDVLPFGNGSGTITSSPAGISCS